MVKPVTGGEATGASIRRAFRGGWGQRAGKDLSRNLGDPAALERVARTSRLRESITVELCVGRESERFIVAKKRVTIAERRGLTEAR
jgi:hypothetical protein